MTYQWYIYPTLGKEAKFKRSLEQAIVFMGWKERFPQVLVPKQELMVIRKKKQTKISESVWAGYVFILAKVEGSLEDTRNTLQQLIGSLSNLGVSTSAKPDVRPVQDSEMEPLVEVISAGKVVALLRTDIKVGDVAQIMEGPFSGVEGRVTEIKMIKNQAQVKLEIEMFHSDREVTVDLKNLQKV